MVVQFSGLISLINIGNSLLLIIYMPEIPDLSKKKKRHAFSDRSKGHYSTSFVHGSNGQLHSSMTQKKSILDLYLASRPSITQHMS